MYIVENGCLLSVEKATPKSKKLYVAADGRTFIRNLENVFASEAEAQKAVERKKEIVRQRQLAEERESQFINEAIDEIRREDNDYDTPILAMNPERIHKKIMSRGGARVGAGRPRSFEEKTVALGVRCDEQTATRLRQAAANARLSLGKMVERLLDEYEK